MIFRQGGTYKDFAHYLRVDIPKVRNIPKLVQALKTASGAIDEQVRAALIWNSGPLVKVKKGVVNRMHPNACAHTLYGQGHIEIGERHVLRFRYNRSWLSVPTGSLNLVGVTLLHELAHWLALKADNAFNGVEHGEVFERQAYGIVFPRCS